jgi:hypothetical protein
MALTSTVAHAMQVGVDSLPSVSVAPPKTTSARPMVVTISSWDAVDHLHWQTACVSSADRVSTDELLVHVEDVDTVSAAVCLRRRAGGR